MTETPINIVDHPTDKHGPRRGDGPIDMLVLHYTGLPTLSDSLDALADDPKEVSAHYLIDTDGSVLALVPEDRRAWHAGVSFWRGITDVNSRSIGIELQNPDGNERPFPSAQIDALIVLSGKILARHPIPRRNVVGHSDIAPDRKADPGVLFPWRLLAEKGIGLWPDAGPGPEAPVETTDAELSELLNRIGYAPDAVDRVAAFQRRFRPQAITNRADAETVVLARAYLALAGTAVHS